MTFDTSQVKIFDLVVNVSGWVPPDMSDWPQNILDGVMMALERKAFEVQLPLIIVETLCDYDEDTGWYLRVRASEVVAKHEPTLHLPPEGIQ